MLRMTNPVRHYAWGSATAFPRLFGMPADGPQAELWMGAHPAAPSEVLLDGARISLDHLPAHRPEMLGDLPELPFLFKVLAAEQPLSIQTHPTAERARAGYAAEEAAGVPLDSPRRRYVDAHHKPELVVAVEHFSALCGFRPGPEAAADVAAVADLLRTAGTGSEGPADTARVDEALNQLRTLLEAERLAEALELILRDAHGGFAQAADLVVPALESVRPGSALCDGAADTLRRAGGAFPGDPGVIVTLLLNRVDLSPGEALYLPAGNLHAYLHGVAVEIMASSDNVLRGGLTAKPVDVDELLAVTTPAVLPLPWCTPEPVSERWHRYAPPCEEFRLDRLELDDGDTATWAPQDGPAVVLCLRGEVLLRSDASEIAVGAGESVLLTAGERAVLTSEGQSEVFVASPGAVPSSAL